MRSRKSTPVPASPPNPADTDTRPVHEVAPPNVHEVVLATRWSVADTRAWLAPLHHHEVTP